MCKGIALSSTVKTDQLSSRQAWSPPIGKGASVVARAGDRTPRTGQFRLIVESNHGEGAKEERHRDRSTAKQRNLLKSGNF